jgi:hypothetical protein
VPAAPVIATIGTVSAAQPSIPALARVSAQGAIRAEVSQVVGSDPNYRILLDGSPEVHFPDFDAYWVSPTQSAIGPRHDDGGRAGATVEVFSAHGGTRRSQSIGQQVGAGRRKSRQGSEAVAFYVVWFGCLRSLRNGITCSAQAG